MRGTGFTGKVSIDVHELSIALSLVEAACEELTNLGPVRVHAVRLRIGALAGVARDALQFSFDAAAAGTPIDGARLDIEEVPAGVWCATCSTERTLERMTRRRCPVCGTVTPDLVRGDDLELVGLEIVDV